MKHYSLRGIREWLATLPPDDPFCADGLCPIATYMVRVLRFPADIAKKWAEHEDPVLACRIDLRCIGHSNWNHLTPRMVLDLITFKREE